MAKYNTDFVDEKYSSIVEPNLFADTVLIPGVTYSNIYEGDAKAGVVKIYKETKDAVADPESPAGDFTNVASANTLIDLSLNNAFRKSKKIYQVTEDSCSYPKAETNLALAVAENRDNRQQSALACLVTEGTQVSSTATTITNMAIEARKALRKKHAKPSVVLATVDAFASMLEEAGSKYTPTTNDRIMTTGQVGQYLGMTWFEVDALDNAAAKYYNYAGTLTSADLTAPSLIVYDPTAFHVVDNLSMMRLQNAEGFTGVLAQNEINSGFRVTNADKVAVVKKAA